MAVEELPDEALVERIRTGESAAYAVLIRRHRERLHAIIYPILRNHSEVEDAIQQGHMQALAHLRQFAGRSSFLTWLTRIMIHEAFGLLRQRKRLRQLDVVAESGEGGRMLMVSRTRSPEQQALDAELRGKLASALRHLPEQYRVVFTLREIDEMSTADAADSLGISEECVRIRLHRARGLLRRRFHRRPRPVSAARACQPGPGSAGARASG